MVFLADLMPDGHFYDPKNKGRQNANTGLQRALYGAQIGFIFKNTGVNGFRFTTVSAKGGKCSVVGPVFSGILKRVI